MTCLCGAQKSKWARLCDDCRYKQLIANATIVEPSWPCNVVDTDTFLDHPLDYEASEYAGRYAHPCDMEPLALSPKREAAALVERVVESLCEEAYDGAEEAVVGGDELRKAFEAALTVFSDAQTATSWVPRHKEIFMIPAQGIVARSDETLAAQPVGQEPGGEAMRPNDAEDIPQ